MRPGYLRLSILALPLVALPCARVSAQQNPGRTGTISGQVRIGDRAAPGIVVTIAPLLPASTWPDTSATTDDAGSYTIADVPPGAWRVRPVAAGFVIQGDLEYAKVTLSEGEVVRGIDFRLVTAARISGRVVTGEGAAIAGAKVYLLKLTQAGKMVPNRVIPVADTNPSGEYEFAAVQEGDYRISVRPWPSGDSAAASTEFLFPGVTTSAEARTLRVGAGAVLTGTDVRCATPTGGASISGRVVDAESGSPIGGKRLAYSLLDERSFAVQLRTDVRSDGEGRFVIRGLKPGRYSVGLFHGESGDLYSRPLAVEVGSSGVTDVEVRALHGLSVTGRVVFRGNVPAEPERPENRFFVGFRPVGVDGSGVKSVRAEVDGAFLLKGLPPGEGSLYTSRVGNQTSDDFALRFLRNGVDLPGGRLTLTGDTDGIMIVLTSGNGVIRGVVRAVSGAIRPARVEVWATLHNPAAGSLNSKAVVNPDGRFLIERLPAGEYSLMVVQFLENGSTRRAGEVRRVVLVPNQAIDVELLIGGGP